MKEPTKVQPPPVASNPHRAGMAQRIVSILGNLQGIDGLCELLESIEPKNDRQRIGLVMVEDLLVEQRHAATALLLAAAEMMVTHPQAFGAGEESPNDAV